MESDLTALNRYLFYEFGLDLEGEDSAVSDSWPFELRLEGILRFQEGSFPVFSFTEDGEQFWAFTGPALSFEPMAGMSFRELKLQQHGSSWVAAQLPVDLDTSLIGYPGVPSVLERRAAVEALLAEAPGISHPAVILEGLFLQATGKYLALVQGSEPDVAHVLGMGPLPIPVGFATASASRRLALAIGLSLSGGSA